MLRLITLCSLFGLALCQMLMGQQPLRVMPAPRNAMRAIARQALPPPTLTTPRTTLPIDDALLNDINLSGPGVRARLTPAGTAYVASVVARAITVEIANSQPAPGEPASYKLRQHPLSVSRARLVVSNAPPSIQVDPLAPNLIHAHLTDMNISVFTLGQGSVAGAAVNHGISLVAPRFTFDVRVSLHRNARGNIALTMEQCLVPPTFPITTGSEVPLPPQAMDQLAHAVANEGALFIQQIVCPRLNHIIEHRINQRFGLLDSKISLGQTTRFDLIKQLAAAEGGVRMARQQTRQPLPSFRRAARQETLRQLRQPSHVRLARQARQGRKEGFHAFINSFNMSRADQLVLDYGLLTQPRTGPMGIEIESSGEIAAQGVRTPFGAQPIQLPRMPGTEMLQIVVSDFVPNTLMYHGHLTGLFNTRVDPSTPQFGPVMRTTCDLSTGSLFCVGDLFPTLRDLVPGMGVAFIFSTLKAPSIIIMPENEGGIKFHLLGLIVIRSVSPVDGSEKPIGEMEIEIDAKMKMRISSKAVRGKVSLENIKLTSRTPQMLMQDELDDAGFLSREILQRMVNDILKQGIPIPVHPLFKLQKPKMSLVNRGLLLETSFQLNQHLINQITAATLTPQ